MKRALYLLSILFGCTACGSGSDFDTQALQGFWIEGEREVVSEDFPPHPGRIPKRCFLFDGDFLESMEGFKKDRIHFQPGFSLDPVYRVPYVIEGKSLKVDLGPEMKSVRLGDVELRGSDTLIIQINDSNQVDFHKREAPEEIFDPGDTLLFRLIGGYELGRRSIHYLGNGVIQIYEDGKMQTGQLKKPYLERLHLRINLAFSESYEEEYEDMSSDLNTSLTSYWGEGKKIVHVKSYGRAEPDELNWLNDFMYSIYFHRNEWLQDLRYEKANPRFGKAWALKNDQGAIYTFDVHDMLALEAFWKRAKVTDATIEDAFTAELLGDFVLPDGTRRWPKKGTPSKVMTDGRFWKVSRWDCPDSTFDLGSNILIKIKGNPPQILREIDYKIPEAQD